MKRIALLLVLPFLAMSLFADEITGASTTSELFVQISSLPEAKVGFTQEFKFPVLRLDNPLVSGNNIRFSLTAEVTPVSMNGIIQTVFSPVAFLEFNTGGRIGAGWPVKLFGSYIYGTGLNLSSASGKEKYDGEAFDALLLKFFIGGTFQFDFAAIFPGDWHHVVVLSHHEVFYHHNTRAEGGQPWYYENDDGENRNGWNYFGNIVLGYQMPIFLSMVAFMAEMELYLYDGDGMNGVSRIVWGDDLVRWKFSNILNFQITDQLSIALITQLRTRRNFTNFDEKYAKKHKQTFMHYQSRMLNTSDKLRLEFYRVAAILSYKF